MKIKYNYIPLTAEQKLLKRKEKLLQIDKEIGLNGAELAELHITNLQLSEMLSIKKLKNK